MTSTDNPRETLGELLPKFRFAMVTTTDPDGKLTARPLTVQEAEFDGDLWFIINRNSSVAQHVLARPGVGVALSTEGAWVSLAGRAEIVEDRPRLRDYWSPSVEAWFPDGSEDPKVTLLRIDAVSGEYWGSAAGRMSSVVSLVKSKITGEPLEGRNGTVEL